MDLIFEQDNRFFMHDGVTPAPGDDEPVDVEEELIEDEDDEDEEDEEDDLDIEKLIEDDVKTDD